MLLHFYTIMADEIGHFNGSRRLWISKSLNPLFGSGLELYIKYHNNGQVVLCRHLCFQELTIDS